MSGPAIRHGHALDAARAGRCPICDSHEVTDDSVDIDGPSVHRAVSCANCGAAWVESYTLDTVSDVEDISGEPVAVYP